jgi:ribosomal protein S18 acetylase RimI-like enzyme
MVTVRAMTDADLPGAVEVWEEAFRAMSAEYGLLRGPRTPQGDLRLQNRMGHFLSTDPGRSFVADDGGDIVGLSQSLVREGYWVLSLLAVAPRFQGRGLGHRLLRLALDSADSNGPGTIQSSRDPRAMALYTSAGFSLHPAVMGYGALRSTVAPDPRVRLADERDLELVEVIDRAVRGSARTVDIAGLLKEPANRLLVAGDRGYAVVQDDRVVTLGARDEGAASALLQTALAEMGQGKTVEVGWLTSSQQWAIRVLAAAGVDLHPLGAVMVRGLPGPPTPYIPSGGYG